MKQSLSERIGKGWERFWFTPADPTVLGLMRICCGLITLYTVIAFTFTLQQFVGPHAWVDLEDRLTDAYQRPIYSSDLNWASNVKPPETAAEVAYFRDYQKEWGDMPPWPYPANLAEADLCDRYRRDFGFDLRYYNMPIPKTAAEKEYVWRFTRLWKEYYSPGVVPAPMPPYPSDLEDNPDPKKETREERGINAYIAHHGVDPRGVYTRGTPVWSIWFHVTDPGWMAVVQGLIIVVTFLFTIGFCTRITSVLTWIGAISYIHRNPYILFGVDTMMNITLIYLMIGPSGAALSVDRWLAHWWREARPRVLGRWRALLGLPAVEIAPGPMPSPRPLPSLSANLAIRLIQIHVCIIYFVAGVSKLQGSLWWTGNAVWWTVANFEFAPMNYAIYSWVLQKLGRNRLVFEIVMTSSAYFTLVFEISYCFLIWRPSTRWVMLGMAIMLHGFIGMFMGLKTFSLMMLVMNMAFLRPVEIYWLLSWFSPKFAITPAQATPEPFPEKERVGVEKSTAIRPAAKETVVSSKAVKRRK